MANPSQDAGRYGPLQVFWIFLRLGLTSFGGPVAHLGYFHDEFVLRRQWLTEHRYADLVALCQFLPGPASSQVGMGLGLLRAGVPGAVAAWLGFTLPSALALALFGIGLASGTAVLGAGALHGLKVVAVAVVAQAVWGMARNLCAGRAQATLMALACSGALLVPGVFAQVGVMLLAAVAGWVLWGPGRAPLPLVTETNGAEDSGVPVRRRTAVAFLLAFVVLLVVLPLAAQAWPGTALALFDAFYRVGALVFGGGHVMLPLLQSVVVPPGWLTADTFLAGYGATQAVPGPLFSFAAFVGAAMSPWPGGWLGALVGLVAIFLPSFLLVVGALPFWEPLRRNPHCRSVLVGVNAAVVGLLLAALYDPVWTSAIHSAADFGLALAALVLLVFWRAPTWAVVLACGAVGALQATWI